MSAVTIYRGPNRFRLYRGFGLFCIGHSILWFGLTYYNGWHKRMKMNQVSVELTDYMAKLKALFVKETSKLAKPEAQDVSTVTTSTTTETSDNDSVRAKTNAQPSWGAGFLSKYFPRIRNFSDNTKQYDDILIPILTGAFGIFTLGMGMLLPRRIVRTISLLPTKANASSIFGPNTLVEIQTYGAFGFRRDGPVFTAPLQKISAVESRTSDNSFIHFSVDKVPFRYIVEKNSAEFPLPEEYDFMFAVNRKT